MTDDDVGGPTPSVPDDEDRPPPRSTASSPRPSYALAGFGLPTAADLPLDPGIMLVIGLVLTLTSSLVVHALQKFSPSLLLLRMAGARRSVKNFPTDQQSADA
ncbi:MAG TPA: hypothetical protein PKE00_16360, partial [Planctomycetota bacterium]|nr:hypothetical protein [Planctomycetota bacterium]